jgi:hypothetical protein
MADPLADRKRKDACELDSYKEFDSTNKIIVPDDINEVRQEVSEIDISDSLTSGEASKMQKLEPKEDKDCCLNSEESDEESEKLPELDADKNNSLNAAALSEKKFQESEARTTEFGKTDTKPKVPLFPYIFYLHECMI